MIGSMDSPIVTLMPMITGDLLTGTSLFSRYEETVVVGSRGNCGAGVLQESHRVWPVSERENGTAGARFHVWRFGPVGADTSTAF